MSTEFGNLLRKLRKSKGLTVNQLALYSGISAAQLSRIENGKRDTPKPPTIKKISEALKAPYEELMKVAGYLEENIEDADDGFTELTIDELNLINDSHLPLEKLKEKYALTCDGEDLTEEEYFAAIATIRAYRSLKNKKS